MQALCPTGEKMLIIYPTPHSYQVCALPLTCAPYLLTPSSLSPFFLITTLEVKEMTWKFLCSSGLRYFTLNMPKTKILALNFNKLASPAHLLIARGCITHACLWPCLQSLLTPVNFSI